MLVHCPIEKAVQFYSLSQSPSQSAVPVSHNQKMKITLSIHYQPVGQLKYGLQRDLEQNKHWKV